MVLKRLCVFLGVIIFICGFSMWGEAFSAGVPKANLATLSRGVSIYGWFNGIPEIYELNHFQTCITQKDISQIKAAGYTHIRLPIEPTFLIGDNISPELKQDRLKELDKGVQMILSEGLGVIIDIHPLEAGDFKLQLFKNQSVQDDLVGLWADLASRYSNLPTQKVFFEPLNEPHFQLFDPQKGPTCWYALQNRIIETIRKQAPHNTIIVAGYDWGTMYAWLQRNALPYQNLVYSFHFYEPMEFTHQGAPWVDDLPIREMHSIPYPPNPEGCKLALADSSAHSASRVNQYCAEYKPQEIVQKFSLIHTWAQHQHVPLYLGEFGVYRFYAPPSDRARWLADIKATAQKMDIPWAVWDYNTTFAVFPTTSAKQD